MAKDSIQYTDYFAETMLRMREDGLLLVGAMPDGTPNTMTIGWGTIGSIWGRPIFTVLVRPSRYTYDFMEANTDFTVNVPPTTKDMSDIVAFCGTVSGKTTDKFKAMDLIATPGQKVNAPIIEQCVIHYECRTLQRNDLDPEAMVPDIRESAYGSGDYHRVYYGEILAAYADEDAADQINSRRNNG